MMFHYITDQKQASEIVVIILKGLCHGFSDRFVAGAHDDCLRPLQLKNTGDLPGIQEISFVQRNWPAGDLFDTAYRHSGRIIKIIDHKRLITFVDQLHTDMRSDIPGSAGD